MLVCGLCLATALDAHSGAHFWCDKATDGSCDYRSSSENLVSREAMSSVHRARMAPRPPKQPVDASTIQNKVLAGYQGWDAARSTWDHWSKDGRAPNPSSKNEHFEMVPQMWEYPKGALRDTGFKYNGNGSTVPLYENAADGVVDLHFRWMADYGLDGVLLQRFISECTKPGPALTQRNLILHQVNAAAAKHGRTYAMMWDMSGASAQWDTDIKNDFRAYVQNYTASAMYLKEKGRPVVCIFGIGLEDHEQATVSSAMSLIRWLQSEGLYVIGSGAYYWRMGGHDALEGFDAVQAAFDALMPWPVGRYHDTADFHTNALPIAQGDAKLTSSRGQDYAPIAFAGYSYRDSNKINYIKRQGGSFFAAQIDAFLALKGASFYYIAMFDEVQEGTAIYKFAANVSESAAGREFVTASVDGFDCPGDLYLTLAGQYATAARGGSTPPPTPTGTDQLVAGDTLNAGGRLVSAGRKAWLAMQTDGNLVLYRGSGTSCIWASNTTGHSGAHLTLQGSDGNLVLYEGATARALWSSAPRPGAARVQLQDDCNLVTKNAKGAVLWALGTMCGSSE